MYIDNNVFAGEMSGKQAERMLSSLKGGNVDVNELPKTFRTLRSRVEKAVPDSMKRTPTVEVIEGKSMYIDVY